MIDYSDRRFVPVSNSANGEVSPEVVFHYKQTGRIVTCTYAGGRIVSGQLIALVDDAGRLDMRYHQVNDRGELMTGVCHSTPEVLADGRIRLHEVWRWTSGDGSNGNSVLEELR
ncbi:MAG TPA: n-acetylglutamate synthase [Flavobacteriales bacterium]|nr:n-acetylglutamate synthase [Flavobacteriales bacterium]